MLLKVRVYKLGLCSIAKFVGGQLLIKPTVNFYKNK